MVLAHDDVFDDAIIAVFIHNLDVVMAARDAVELIGAAAVFDDIVAQLVWTPRVLMRRREVKLVYVPIGVVHNHELGLLWLRRCGVRPRGQRHHRERHQDRAQECDS